MRKKILSLLLCIALAVLSCNLSWSQDREKISPYIQLQHFKYTDNKCQLRAILTYSANRMELPLPDMMVSVYSGREDKILLGNLVTDEKGIAEINISSDSNLVKESDGSWPFSASFNGNDTIEGASADIDIIDIDLKMDLTESDSIKTVQVTVSKNENGKIIPAAGESLTVYVPRMFSLLPVSEIILDDSGSGSIEFPNDLPGGKDGMLTIIARFEDHPDYGTVERKATVRWGRLPGQMNQAGHRALWTKTAPKWMIYTLIILLSGVWAHYIFTIVSLIRIRRSSTRKKKESK